MAKKRRKQEHCANCGHHFQEALSDNYCSNCGQENTTKNVSWYLLLKDLRENYVSLESKLFRSIWYLLFKPGFLTIQYIQGKRQPYLMPMRLYLIASVVYFSIFITQILSSITFDDEKDTLSLKQMAREHLPEDSLIQLFRKTVEEERKKDVTLDENIPNFDAKIGNINVSPKEHKSDFKRIRELAQKYKPKTVMDTLNAENNFFVSKWHLAIITQQLLKIEDSHGRDFGRYVLGMFPITMFLLMPFLALFFKVVYLFSKRYYIEHLIFCYHYHAFLYFSLAALFLFLRYWPESTFVVMLTIFIVWLYFFLALKRVYQKGILVTLFKNLIFILFYPVCLSILVVFSVVVSFFIF